MTISSNISTFNGLAIEIYSKEKGIQNPGSAYKIMVDYEEAEDDIKIADKFKSFIEDPNASQVQALIIGNWEESFESSPDDLVQLMVENVDKLKSLKALFIGEMTYEECEISWIQGSDCKELIKAFKNLELLRLRGDFTLGTIDHDNLKSLIIETGGLQQDTIKSVINSKMPALEHLELWLGVEDYGFDGDLNLLKPLFDNNPFPKLNYLGMRNSEIVDDIAVYLANHEILDQLDILDLSLGIMTDRGAKALLAGSKVKSLKKLDLHHHYISNDVMLEFNKLEIEEVDISDKEEEEDEDYRYVYVSE